MQKPKVFISSTFKDLENYRTEVDKTIRVLDSESISMEHFGSDHRKPLEVCLRAIDDCELFVGIYALRYGFIPPNETRSITELEYLHALAKGKPILAFVAKDTIQYEPAYVSEGISTDLADIKKLNAFKTQIELDQVMREFVTIDELGKFIAIELGKYYVKIIKGKTLSNPVAHLPLPKGIFYPTVSPYVGLRYFSRNEAKVFSGRNQLIFDLYNSLQKDEPIVLVYGQTGVGKSSVLEAGLLPRLEARGWNVKTLRRQKELGLPLQWQEAIHPWNASKRLLVIDQAEELWTLPNPSLATEKQDFFAALRLLIDSYDPNGKLIISFRKEFLAEMETGLREQNLPHLKVLVKPMNQPELMEAITQIKEDAEARMRYQVTITDDLPHEMAYDLRRDDQSHLAPLLQVTLSRMWALAVAENPDSKRTFDQTLYDRVKTESLEGFLYQQLDQIAQQHPEAVKTGLVLDLLHYLTTEMGTAAQCTLTDLHARYPHVGQLEALVFSCENAYLFLKPSPQTLRLSHDALAPLVQKAYRLSEAPGPKAARILDAKDLTQNTEEHFTEIEIKTLQAGQQGMRQWNEAEQKAVEETQKVIVSKRQRLRRNNYLLSALVIAIVLVGYFIYNLSQNENSKKAKFLANESELYSPSEAFQLLLYADKLDPYESEVSTKLMSRILSEEDVPIRTIDLKHDSTVSYTEISKSGKYVLTLASDNTVRIWSVEGKLQSQMSHPSKINTAIFSPKSNMVLTASDDSTAKLWTLDGRQIRSFPHLNAVKKAVFSNDGSKILTLDSLLTCWDIRGKTLFKLAEKERFENAYFSYDDQQIATAVKNGYGSKSILRDNNGLFIKEFNGGIVFSKSNDRIAIKAYHLSEIYDQKLRLIKKIDAGGSMYNSVDFSFDGNYFITSGTAGGVALWDKNGSLIRRIELNGPCFGAFFTKNNKIVVNVYPGTVILDADGTILKTIYASRFINYTEFSYAYLSNHENSWDDSFRFSTHKTSDKTTTLTDLNFTLKQPLMKAYWRFYFVKDEVILSKDSTVEVIDKHLKTIFKVSLQSGQVEIVPHPSKSQILVKYSQNELLICNYLASEIRKIKVPVEYITGHGYSKTGKYVYVFAENHTFVFDDRGSLVIEIPQSNTELKALFDYETKIYYTQSISLPNDSIFYKWSLEKGFVEKIIFDRSGLQYCDFDIGNAIRRSKDTLFFYQNLKRIKTMIFKDLEEFQVINSSAKFFVSYRKEGKKSYEIYSLEGTFFSRLENKPSRFIGEDKYYTAYNRNGNYICSIYNLQGGLLYQLDKVSSVEGLSRNNRTLIVQKQEGRNSRTIVTYTPEVIKKWLLENLKTEPTPLLKEKYKIE